MPPDSWQSLIPSENGTLGAKDSPPWICSLDSESSLLHLISTHGELFFFLKTRYCQSLSPKNAAYIKTDTRLTDLIRTSKLYPSFTGTCQQHLRAGARLKAMGRRPVGELSRTLVHHWGNPALNMSPPKETSGIQGVNLSLYHCSFQFQLDPGGSSGGDREHEGQWDNAPNSL